MRAKRSELTKQELLWTKRIIEEGACYIKNMGYRDQYDDEINVPGDLDLLHMKLLSILKLEDVEDPAWS